MSDRLSGHIPTNLLSPDKAQTDPDNDGLGYALFAQHLANSIIRMTPTDGLVMAIYGKWGSGKTTLLNFVVHHLEQAPQNEQPIIVHFNPWWFSGHEDLARRFFDQIQAALPDSSAFIKKLRGHLADFAELVAETPVPYASTGKAVAKAARPQPQDVPALKKMIADELVKRKVKILVIIDDIDRLTGEEIRQIFRVIKAVGDFPNLIYLLAFDKEVAVKAVEQMQDLPGEAYLEKIVQVPFELPLPDRDALRRLMWANLETLFANTPADSTDTDHLLSIYAEGVEPFLQTPRDVVRLANSLSVTYPAVEGEVNPADFLAIEALRVFRPKIYDVIRKNSGAFAGYAPDSTGGHTSYRREALKSFCEGFIEGVAPSERERIKGLLMILFPKLQSIWKNTWYGAESVSEWRRHLRICSPDLFETYFRLAIPEGSLSNTEIKRIIATTGDVATFSALLLEASQQKRPDGATRTRLILDRLEDYTEETIELSSIPPIIETLLDVGDQLRLADPRRGMFDPGIKFPIARILHQLITRFDEPQRFAVLKEAMSRGQAVACIVQEVITLAQQHGKYDGQPKPEEDQIVNPLHLAELEKLALEKIRDCAKRSSLLHTPGLPQVLSLWQEWAGVQEVSRWVRKTIKTDEGLLTLLERFLTRNFSQVRGHYVQHTHYRLDPEWFKSYVDTDLLMQRVASLAQRKDLTDEQRIAVTRIAHEHVLRQQGKNPDSHSDDYDD